MKIIIALLYFWGLFAGGNQLPKIEHALNIIQKNEREIFIHKRLIEIRQYTDTHILWKNEQILKFDTKTGKTEKFLNGNFSTRSKFLISTDGNRILQINYSENRMHLLDNNGRKLSTVSQKNIIIDPKNDNCRIYDKYLFWAEYAQNKPCLAVMNLMTGETRRISVKAPVTPADIPIFTMEYKLPVFRSDSNNILTFDFSKFRLSDVFSLPDKTGWFFLNRNGNQICFEKIQGNGKRKHKKLIILDLKTGSKTYLNPPQNFYLIQASDRFFVFYTDPTAPIKNKNEMNVLLCNHQCKVLKTYKLQKIKDMQPFPRISSDEKALIFWTFGGEIKYKRIPDKFLQTP